MRTNSLSHNENRKMNINESKTPRQPVLFVLMKFDGHFMSCSSSDEPAADRKRKTSFVSLRCRPAEMLASPYVLISDLVPNSLVTITHKIFVSSALLLVAEYGARLPPQPLLPSWVDVLGPALFPLGATVDAQDTAKGETN